MIGDLKLFGGATVQKLTGVSEVQVFHMQYLSLAEGRRWQETTDNTLKMKYFHISISATLQVKRKGSISFV